MVPTLELARLSIKRTGATKEVKPPAERPGVPSVEVAPEQSGSRKLNPTVGLEK